MIKNVNRKYIKSNVRIFKVHKNFVRFDAFVLKIFENKNFLFALFLKKKKEKENESVTKWNLRVHNLITSNSLLIVSFSIEY